MWGDKKNFHWDRNAGVDLSSLNTVQEFLEFMRYKCVCTQNHPNNAGLAEKELKNCWLTRCLTGVCLSVFLLTSSLCCIPSGHLQWFELLLQRILFHSRRWWNSSFKYLFFFILSQNCRNSVIKQREGTSILSIFNSRQEGVWKPEVWTIPGQGEGAVTQLRPVCKYLLSRRQLAIVMGLILLATLA